MRQYRDNDFDLFFDSYSQKELNVDTLDLTAQCVQEVSVLRAKEAIADRVGKLFSVKLPSLESYLYFEPPDECAFPMAAASDLENDKEEYPAIAHIYDETAHTCEPISISLQHVRVIHDQGYYRYSGSVNIPSAQHSSGLVWLDATCLWKAKDKQEHAGDIELDQNSMTFVATIKLPKNMIGLPGKPDFRFICRCGVTND